MECTSIITLQQMELRVSLHNHREIIKLSIFLSGPSIERSLLQPIKSLKGTPNNEIN
jgi:hypothetical protein